MRTVLPGLALAVLTALTTVDARADSVERLIERMDRLEEENRELRKELDALKAQAAGQAQTAPPQLETDPTEFVRFNARYAYEILDPTTDINRKQRLILERRKDGTLAPDRLHVQGAVTAAPTSRRATGTTSSVI